MTNISEIVKLRLKYFIKYLATPLLVIYGALILLSLKDGLILTLRFISGTSPILVLFAYIYGVTNSVRQYKEDFSRSMQAGITRNNYLKSMITSDLIIALFTSALVVIMNGIGNSMNIGIIQAIYTSNNYFIMFISLVIPMFTWISIMNLIGSQLYKLDFKYKRIGIILLIILMIGIFYFTDISSMDGLDAENLPSMILIVFIINMFNPSLLVMASCILISLVMYYLIRKTVLTLEIRK
ncbi:MAG: hypothetical protein GXZ08_09420 [Tissierellia bacterium]|nr:hypothetical protein [Tissierellia bacterium]